MSRAKIALAVGSVITSTHAHKHVVAAEPLEPRRLLAAGFDDISADYNTAPMVVGGGGYATGIVIHPTADVRYLWTDVGGAQRRVGPDGEWEQLTTVDRFADFASDVKLNDGYVGGGVDGMAISISDSNVVYMAYADRVYRSGDQGDSWTPTSLDVNTYPNDGLRQFNERLAVDPTDPDTVYFASDAGLSKSTDGGVSWTHVAPTVLPSGGATSGVFTVAVDPADGDHVYAAVEGSSLAVSGDAWTSAPFRYDITDGSKLRFDFSSAVEGELQAIGFDTDNNASNGQVLFNLHGTAASDVVSSRKEGTYAERLATIGLGKTEYEIDLSNYAGQSIERLVFVHDDNGSGGNTKSHSSYANIRVDGGSNPKRSLDLSAVSLSVYDASKTGQHLAGVYEGGLWRSDDAGQTWSPMTDAATGLDGNKVVTDIEFLPGSSSTVLFTLDSKNATGHELFKYRPGAGWGASGADIASIDPRPTSNDRYRSIAVDANNPGVWLVEAANHSPSYVTDAGANATPGDFTSVEVDKNNTEFLWMQERQEQEPENVWSEFSEVAFDPHFEPGGAALSRLWLTGGVGAVRADNFQFDPAAGTASYTKEIDTSGNEETIGTDLLSLPGKPWVLATTQDLVGFRFTNPSANNAQRFYPAQTLHFAYDLAYRPNDPDYVTMTAWNKQSPGNEDAYLSGYSTNGGLTWNVFDSISDDGDIVQDDDSTHPNDLKFGTVVPGTSGPGFEDNLVWMPLSGDRQPYFSTDGGATWNKPSSYPTQPDGSPVETQGFNWYFRYEGLVADPNTPGTFYAYLGVGKNEGNNFIKTTDGGDTWSVLPAPGDVFAFHGKLLHAVGPDGLPDADKAGDLWATRGGGSDGSGKLWRSTHDTNGNVTGWNAIPGIKATDIAFGKGAAGSDYPTLYVSGVIDGQNGIFRSTDEGATWSLVSQYPAGISTEPQSVAGDWNEFGRFYVSLGGSGFAYGDDSPLPTTIDQKPIAVTDELETDRDTAATVAVLANDSDPDGDPISLIDFKDGEYGTVTRSGDSLVYTPDSGFVGPDAFTYTITDGRGLVATGTVEVDVAKPFVAGQYLVDGDFLPSTGFSDTYTVGTDDSGIWYSDDIAETGGNDGRHIGPRPWGRQSYHAIDVSQFGATETWTASVDLNFDVNKHFDGPGIALFGMTNGQTLTKNEIKSFFQSGQAPASAVPLTDPAALTLPETTIDTNGWVTISDEFVVDLSQFDEIIVALRSTTGDKGSDGTGSGIRGFDNVSITGPAGDGQAAFDGPRSVTDGTVIEAEAYDVGGQGVAYNDDDRRQGNQTFRPGDNVDIGNKSNATGGLAVGYTKGGEWLEYTINSAVAGDYEIVARYSSGLSSSSSVGNLKLLLDSGSGFDTIDTLTLGATGGWNAFTTTSPSSSFSLGSGSAVLRVENVGGGFDIDHLVFNQASPPTQTLRFNFQADTSPTPSGYLADTGFAYGDRGNGFSYGWVGGDNFNTRDRNVDPDDRLDTLNHLQRGGQDRQWRAAVANGTYRLTLAAGDPSYTNSQNNFLIEGVLLSDQNVGSDLFADVLINVNDGFLDLSVAPGALNAKVQYLDLVAV
jgi:hypothetical protein